MERTSIFQTINSDMKKKKLLEEIELELSSKELIKCSGLLNGSPESQFRFTEREKIVRYLDDVNEGDNWHVDTKNGRYFGINEHMMVGDDIRTTEKFINSENGFNVAGTIVHCYGKRLVILFHDSEGYDDRISVYRPDVEMVMSEDEKWEKGLITRRSFRYPNGMGDPTWSS